MSRFIKKTAATIHHSHNDQQRSPYFVVKLLLTHKSLLHILPLWKRKFLSRSIIYSYREKGSSYQFDEFKQQNHSRDSVPLVGEYPRKRFGTKVCLFRAASASGVIQRRSDGAACQDSRKLTPIKSRTSSGSTFEAAG